MSDKPYVPQSMEVIFETSDVRVVEIGLPGFGATPEHRHTLAQEICYCLEGELTCEVVGQTPVVLKPGHKMIFPANQEHTLSNRDQRPCRFLLIHGIGAFDFVASR